MGSRSNGWDFQALSNVKEKKERQPKTLEDRLEKINNAFIPKDQCSICDGDYDPDCGGVQGYFGMTPVTFCEWCHSSIISMTMQHLGLDEDGEKLE